MPLPAGHARFPIVLEQLRGRHCGSPIQALLNARVHFRVHGSESPTVNASVHLIVRHVPRPPVAAARRHFPRNPRFPCMLEKH
ncbi:hypothetical protein SHJG_6908 [Streptomyces hygroscopicus subsp. jinggangensis 5008]|nr:hypothetical protein SHJG_6908 [Streptomyces hygroscopicus subsp. jinggangensis 5008]AGF66330.1 hypothetical protein SHJGH_6668 [Streptomyces hygroscopicus subsp. jinggangensis TL01]